MVADRSTLRNSLAATASEQSGYFTAAQALRIGYSYPQQTFHVFRGNWIRIDRGLFRLPHWPTGPDDDLVRASLWARGRGIVSHESAAAAHELAELDPLRTHLTVPRGFRGKHPAVVLHVGDVPPGEIESRPGFRVTNVLRTLVDVAGSGADLDQLARAIRTALDRHLISLRDLRRRAEQLDVRAALGVERALLEAPDAPQEK